ncbi:unnamed protein product [Ambrosiozyma monospora]|uniref:Unnamed protein product n=1 Tax=Ambrosiozyma monospora TaxID=43982 RepID=A0ACB5SWA0_AMBMO|nr:unnamed protein product [Ambrosiozyma monospora]
MISSFMSNSPSTAETNALYQILKNMTSYNLRYGLLTSASRVSYLKVDDLSLQDDSKNTFLWYRNLALDDRDSPIGYVLVMLMLERYATFENKTTFEAIGEEMSATKSFWNKVFVKEQA